MAAPSSVFAAIWKQIVLTDVPVPQYFSTDNKDIAVGLVEQIGVQVDRCAVGQYVMYKIEGRILFQTQTSSTTVASFYMTDQNNILGIIAPVP